MAHAAFPLPATPTTLVDARARRLIRTIALPAALAVAVATLTATALVQLESDSDRLAAAVTTREAVNRQLVDDRGTAQRTRAISAERAEGLQPIIADQLAALDSREGFLP